MFRATKSSNDTYNSEFARYYDRITTHKDYQAEIDALVSFMRQAVREIHPNILDVGCGTGTHAALLSRKGYDVTAIDVSPDMISVAKSGDNRLKFVCGQVAELEDSDFNFCYSIFNVINCLESIDILIAFFKEIFARLLDGGVLLFECWNPIAVIAAPPRTVERKFESNKETIIRKVVPSSDFLHQRLDLQYQISVYSGGKSEKPKRFSVTHHLILFTPLEIDYSLRQAGFKEIQIKTALPEMAPAGPKDRMLVFTCKK